MRKKEPSIPLSPKHGVNPSLMRCPICHKDMGIALFGKLKGDIEAPKYVDGDLCDDCKKIYTTILEATFDRKPTGRCAYIKREVIKEEFRNHDTLLMTQEDFSNLLLKSQNPE